MRRLLLLALLGACSRDNANGLPPASSWQSGDQPTPPPSGMAQAPRANVDSSDPHAGMFRGGEGDGADPHAGIPGAPPIGGGGGGDPTTDVTQLGFSSPDPNRAIDPTKKVTGTLQLTADVKTKVSPGAAVFLMIKRAGPDGQPTGMPLAVDKVAWAGEQVSFDLGEKQAMVSNTEFAGDVVIIARVDRDQDASTRQPGDVVGMARAKIPSSNIVVKLDTILQ